MKNLFLSSLSLLFLSSCMEIESSYPKPERVVHTTYSNEVLPLEKMSLSCMSKSFTEFEATYPLLLQLDGRITEQTEIFSGLLRGLFLRDGTIIGRSTYGESVELIFGSSLRQRQIMRPLDIKLCPDDANYPQDTVESAALNTSHFIKKTYHAFRSAVSNIRIAPITLSISPLIVRSIFTQTTSGRLKQSTYFADNAIYLPSANTVTFLPASKDFKGPKFWEVPMVASHEYGHHIFNSIYPVEESEVAAHGTCFGEHNPSINASNDFNISNFRSVTRRDVLMAYNEGFADLISYYSLDQHERGVKGVHCLEVTRDVGSSRIINGKTKIFSEEVLSSFFSHSRDFMRGGCNNPSFQEIHVLGAIFAYNANRFLETITDSDKEKIKSITNWLSFLNYEKSSNGLLSPRDYLETTFASFIRLSLAQYDQSFNARNCRLIEKMYPSLEIPECARL